MQTAQKHRWFGSWSFYRYVMRIALPVMIQCLVSNLVSLIDNFMVSGLGDIKMSGVNIAGQIIFIFMTLISSICAAGGIFMTQYFGAKEERGMRQSLHFKIVCTTISTAIYMFVCMVVPRKLLSLMVIGNTQAEEIMVYAEQYIFLLGFAGIPMGIANILGSSLREIGEVKAPLYISVAATLVNTFFNWVFIYGNLGAPRLEVRGAAIATLIAYVAQTVMYIWYVKKRRQPFMLHKEDIGKIDWKLFMEVLKKGGMIIFSDLVWVLCETVTTALYNGRGGADVVSGMSSSFAIANLYFVSFSGMYTAGGVIIGKLLGEGRLDEAREQKTWLLTGSTVFGFAMTLFGFATIPLVGVVFGALSDAAQEICRSMVFFMALAMPLWLLNNTMFAVSRAGGDTQMGMWIDGVGNLLMLPGIFLLAYFTTIGPVAMYIATKSVDVIKVAVALWWLKKERWVKNLTLDNPM